MNYETDDAWGGRYGQDVPYGSGAGLHENAREEVPSTKRCPRCGAELFSDMDICYACLYDFSKERAEKRRSQMPTMPGDPSLTTADVVGLVDAARPSGQRPSPELEDLDPWDFEDLDDPEDDQPPLPDAPEGWSDIMATSSIRPAHAGHAWGRDRDGSTTVLPCLADAAVPLGVRVETEDMDVTCRIPAEGLGVGREADNDVILRARSVSRHHVRIFSTGAGVVVEDQGSTNPAMVLGRPVTGRRALSLGDTLDIGGASLTLVPVEG